MGRTFTDKLGEAHELPLTPESCAVLSADELLSVADKSRASLIASGLPEHFERASLADKIVEDSGVPRGAAMLIAFAYPESEA